MATKIYEGKYTNSSDQLYLVENGKIYKGKYSNSSDLIREVKPEGIKIENSKVYKGKYTYSSDQIMLIEGNKIFKGKYSNSSDQIALIDGDRLADSDFEKIVYLLAQRNNLI